jgi:predicted molibdopterin-dependent oxidoreductase YjgC
MFGSNAREAHPIFFHHVIKAVRRGARLYVIDPRQTPTAQWSEAHLPVNVGGDIALANAMANVILEEGLVDQAFIENATSGYPAWAETVARYRPEDVASLTGVDPALVRKAARDYATADRAMICWTLGITEHANAVDNVLSLINLALATGHVGKWGSGLNPLRGQNNVQGGGDMGALPHKLPGFQDVDVEANRVRCESVWGTPGAIPPNKGWHLTEMFEAMDRGELRALFVLGENPAVSEANASHAVHLLEKLDFLVVQDIFRTQTAELADVVLPATAAWCETEGTVTNSERRVQRCRKAVEGPPGARDDIAILGELASRLGVDLRLPSAEAAWEELRRVSPMHGGMSYARIEALGGIQWPCPDEGSQGSEFLHGRLWSWAESPADPAAALGPRAPFHVVEWAPVADPTDADFPVLLTTGRKLDAYNTGVQSAALGAPLSKREALELSPADAARYGVAAGERVRVRSRRGFVETEVRLDPLLREGLAFMTFHHPDEVDTNQLTTDASDPRSGTAEFKATAIRIERLGAGLERLGAGAQPAAK